MSVLQCESRSTDKRTLNALEQAMAQRVNTQVTISIRSIKVDAGDFKHELLNRLRSNITVNVLNYNLDMHATCPHSNLNHA